MLRTCLVASALCLALMPRTVNAEPAPEIPMIPLRAEVMAAASGLPAESWVCSPMVAAPDHADDSTRWRLAAYHHLDCATSVLERAETNADDEDDTVTISKEELDDLRSRLYWARDAAARIGR